MDPEQSDRRSTPPALSIVEGRAPLTVGGRQMQLVAKRDLNRDLKIIASISRAGIRVRERIAGEGPEQLRSRIRAKLLEKDELDTLVALQLQPVGMDWSLQMVGYCCEAVAIARWKGEDLTAIEDAAVFEITTGELLHGCREVQP